MIPTYTTQQKSISPTIALVRHVSTKKHITLDFPNGVNFNAIYINHFTREIIRQEQIRFSGPITVHLMASDIQNCYYLAWWHEKSQQHICSCYAFRKSDNRFCSHTDELNHQQDEAAAEPVVEPSVTAIAEQEEVAPRNTAEYWIEIVRKGKERDRAFLDGYWREAKLLQLQSRQEVRQQHGL